MGEQMDSCIEWTGARDSKGYGNKNIAGKYFKTHRLAYAWVNGPIPDGMWVLHKCDNPPCCNPDHLFLGTHKDNMRDMKEKGRAKGLVGTENHKATLTEAQVLEIRFDNHGRKYGRIRRLSEKHGVSRAVVDRIRRNETWKHLLIKPSH